MLGLALCLWGGYESRGSLVRSYAFLSILFIWVPGLAVFALWYTPNRFMENKLGVLEDFKRQMKIRGYLQIVGGIQSGIAAFLLLIVLIHLIYYKAFRHNMETSTKTMLHITSRVPIVLTVLLLIHIYLQNALVWFAEEYRVENFDLDLRNRKIEFQKAEMSVISEDLER